MKSPQLPSRDIVLVGAGHTNLHIVRMWRMKPVPDVRLTLISPFCRATYSGMLPGSLAGLYGPDEMEIDLARLTMSCGVRLIIDEVVGCDPNQRRFSLKGRPAVQFDVASIGIGSIPGQREIWHDHPQVLSIKPMATFRRRLEERLAMWAGRDISIANRSSPMDHALVDQTSQPLRIAVVGGGAAGVEVSLCLDVWLRERGWNGQVLLIDGGREILKGYLASTRQRLMREFQRRKIPIHIETRVAGHAAGQLLCVDDARIPADIVIWATSAAPPVVLSEFLLPKTEDGFLAVRPTLQTTADAPIFVVGDTASFPDQPIPKAGVYAVREAPVLWENLGRMLSGQPLKTYRPQRDFLSLLAMGDGRAVAQYWGFSATGMWIWKLKDGIDRTFMRKYQMYDAPVSMKSAATRAASGIGEPMRCAGCGGKTESAVLSAALDRLGIRPNENPTRDDAAVLPAGREVNVLSVDFFQSFIDDPYLVGRVAALNALSDIWAMGSVPTGALAIVGIPSGSASQQAEMLFQLLAGGLRELEAAGAELWGGHTIETDDLLIGFATAGKTERQLVWTKGGLRPGDQLILTKPLGTGTLLAAHRQAACRGVWIETMFAEMLRSQAAAVEVLRQFSVRSVTDVTGFGLGGHLREMLDASGVSVRLNLDAIPLLPGFAELSEQGFESSLAASNWKTLMPYVEADLMVKDHLSLSALVDPQTHGGLLCGVPAGEATEVLTALQQRGMNKASVVGEILEDTAGRILVSLP